MEIQSITGPDIIPQGPTARNTAVVETPPETERENTNKRPEEENKGRNIDQTV